MTYINVMDVYFLKTGTAKRKEEVIGDSWI